MIRGFHRKITNNRCVFRYLRQLFQINDVVFILTFEGHFETFRLRDGRPLKKQHENNTGMAGKALDRKADPSPATHATLTVLKASHIDWGRIELESGRECARQFELRSDAKTVFQG